MMTGQPTAENGDTGTPSAAQEKPLRESLGDASVLLWFATREGRKVDDGVLRDIVSAQAKLREGGRDPAVEGSFWVACRELAKAVQPASIDSILATYSYPFGYHHNKTGKRRLTDAAATKRTYSIVSVGVLVLLLVVQIYWFIGTTWRTDLETHRAELDRIAGSIREMSLEAKVVRDFESHLENIKEQHQNGSVRDTGPDINLTNNKNPRVAIEESLQILMDRQDRRKLSYANWTLRGDRVEKMLHGNYKMLNIWDFVTNMVELVDAGETGGASGTGAITGEASGTGAANSMCSGDDVDEFNRILCEKANALEREQLGVEDALVNSKSTLAVLSQYLLPLLYGLIGSLAYILRTLSSEIQNVTFTRGSEIRYALRWPLGMLGGVTVGLFFDPAHFSGFAAITPLGLAFLAGYGVELLFTGLDRFVRAFTSEDAARPKVA
jgi:hypothetical protein